MYTICWSSKGGSGTTVVAAALGLTSARSCPTTLVDLGGDLGPALGAQDVPRSGVTDWLAAPRASGDRLLALAQPISTNLSLISCGSELDRPRDDADDERLAAACRDCLGATGRVVIDAGTGIPSLTLHRCADTSLLVLRPCYLALRRAAPHAFSATGIVLQQEPGRALGVGDIEHALSRPVLANIAWDPAVARAVDSGTLLTRLPGPLANAAARLHRCEPTAAPS